MKILLRLCPVVSFKILRSQSRSTRAFALEYERPRSLDNSLTVTSGEP